VSATQTSTDDESIAQEWVAGFTEAWREPRGPDAFIERCRGLLAPDVRLLQPQLPTTVGFRAFEEQFVAPVFALIPDLHADVERWAGREDSLYIEFTLRGTLAGRPLSWRACDRITLRDGMAVERESYFDPSSLIAAVAMTPRAWPRFLRGQARNLTNDLADNLSRRRRR
jgi:ketosteroid isomerase-like protein